MPSIAQVRNPRLWRSSPGVAFVRPSEYSWHPASRGDDERSDSALDRAQHSRDGRTDRGRHVVSDAVLSRRSVLRRLDRRCRRGRRRCGRHAHVHRHGAHAGARRRRSGSDRSSRRAPRSERREPRVQPVGVARVRVCGRDVARRLRADRQLRRVDCRGCRDAKGRHHLSVLVPARTRARFRSSDDGLGAARDGDREADDGDSGVYGASQRVARAGADCRLGYGSAARCRRRGTRKHDRDRHRRGAAGTVFPQAREVRGVSPRSVAPADRRVAAHARRWAPGRRGVRAHVHLHGRDLLGHPRFRVRGAGGFRYRLADHAVDLHAGDGHRIRRGPDRRPKLRCWARRSRSRDVLQSRVAQHGRHGVRDGAAAVEARGARWILHVRNGCAGGRRHVLAQSSRGRSLRKAWCSRARVCFKGSAIRVPRC